MSLVDHLRHWAPATLASLLLLSLAPLGCDTAKEVENAPRAAPERPIGMPSDDLLRLSVASRPYIEIQVAGLEPEHAAIRAPARVAFRDGAMSRVSAPIPGRVVKLHVEVGETVKVGDSLVTITSPEASGFHMELSRARIDLQTAQDQLERQTTMVSKGVGREHERVLAEHRVAETKAKLRHAQKAVSLLGQSSNGTVVITAAIEGTVLRRFTTLGAQVEPGGDSLIEIGNPNALWVVAEVFQDDLSLVSPGAKVTLEFANIPKPVTGHVEGMGVLIDTGLRRAPIYVAIDEDAPGLTPGMFARANIQTPIHDGVTIPKTAVLIKDGKTAVVYVEETDGQFSRRVVTTGHTFGEYVQILGGVQAGDRVAVAGALLIDGTAQKIL